MHESIKLQNYKIVQTLGHIKFLNKHFDNKKKLYLQYEKDEFCLQIPVGHVFTYVIRFV